MDIRYRPATKISIHKLSKRTLDEFIHINVTERDGDPIYCNGVIFLPYLYHDTEHIIKDRVENDHIHYSDIIWCRVDKYIPKLARKNISFEREVINMDSDEFFRELTEFIKTL